MYSRFSSVKWKGECFLFLLFLFYIIIFFLLIYAVWCERMTWCNVKVFVIDSFRWKSAMGVCQALLPSATVGWGDWSWGIHWVDKSITVSGTFSTFFYCSSTCPPRPHLHTDPVTQVFTMSTVTRDLDYYYFSSTRLFFYEWDLPLKSKYLKDCCLNLFYHWEKPPT